MHIGVAQVQSRVGDPWGNLERIRIQAASASTVGVEVLLFAETVVHAYDMSSDNLRLAEGLGGPLTQRLAGYAVAYSMVLLAGFLERDGDSVYNSQAIAYPDGTLAVQRKHNITEAEAKAGISPGPLARTIFNIHGVPCAVLICADTGIPGIFGEISAQGARYCFIPTAGGGKRGDYLRAKDLDTARGREAYLANRPRVFQEKGILDGDGSSFAGWASANALGDDGRDAVHQGHCMIVDTRRVMRAQIPGTNVIDHFLDQMAHAIVDFDS